MSAPARGHGGRRQGPIVGLITEVAGGAGHAARARAIAVVGVGVPGPVDVDRGIVGEPVTHVPELAGRPVAAELRARVGLPVFVDNDVNALALGEATLGAARGARSLVVLSTGTGIGAGIVLEGRLVRGAAGFGGELGHSPVKFDGPRRHLAAGERSALSATAGGDPAAVTAAMVFGAAQEGDALAAAIVDEACRALGAMIGTIVNGLNPEVLIVTGGVVESLARLEAKILGATGEYAFPRALAATRIEMVPGDKRASVRGAAALARYEQTVDRRRAR